jgi:hypothetical protein
MFAAANGPKAAPGRRGTLPDTDSTGQEPFLSAQKARSWPKSRGFPRETRTCSRSVLLHLFGDALAFVLLS